MVTLIMDTYEYASKLRAGGFTEQQAEAQARALAEIVEKQWATQLEVAEHQPNLRRDLKEAELRLQGQIREAELRLEARIAETNSRIAEARADVIKWVLGLSVAQTGLIVGLMAKFTHVI
jgi:hypothetical protein